MDDLIQEMLEPDRPAPGVVARRRRLTATTAIIGLAAIGVTSLTTNALFTDQDDPSQSGFVSGTIDITTSATDFEMPVGNAAPGDHHYAPIEVTNSGSLQLRYAVSLSGVGATPLLDNLAYSVATGLSPAACSALNAPPVPANVIGSAVLGTAATHWIGDNATGQQGGDRTLNAGQSEVLCVGLSFDIDAPDTVQGETASVSFEFYAEQTANNP
ncbi:MAG: CalY family protein [Actinomycetota bacterium]|nr:CalY family protein [Actinomycetota bacterium]